MLSAADVLEELCYEGFSLHRTALTGQRRPIARCGLALHIRGGERPRIDVLGSRCPLRSGATKVFSHDVNTDTCLQSAKLHMTVCTEENTC